MSVRGNHLARCSMSILIVFTLAAWSCGKKEEPKTSAPAPPPAASTPQPSTPPPNPQAATPAPTLPSAASVKPALATADGEYPGLRVEIQELKRTSGDTVTLKFAMINDSDKGLGFGSSFVEKGKDSADYGGISGVYLADPIGKKQYFVLRDEKGQCLCSRSIPTIADKSRANLWAKFPAPPADVQKVTIVIPHFTPMEDVPLGQ
jgi:hypothetical protein